MTLDQRKRLFEKGFFQTNSPHDSLKDLITKNLTMNSIDEFSKGSLFSEKLLLTYFQVLDVVKEAK